MNLVVLGVVALVISVPIVVWDLATANNPSRIKQGMMPYTQIAYLVMFVAGFGLLLKVMSFAAVLLLATVLTGVIWAWDWWVTKRERAAAPARTEPSVDRKDSAQAAAQQDAQQRQGVIEPIWLELCKSFFPVILIVFFVRSFLVEPFRIPSGSMKPTLLIGDFILVNKFSYGIRLPVANKKLVEIGQPQRGDVIVFRYPIDPAVDYIKRVVGLPGDTIMYNNKRLTINGQPVPVQEDGVYSELQSDARLGLETLDRYRETLGSKQHSTLIDRAAPVVMLGGVREFPSRDRCSYGDAGFTCTVPDGHYFMMGDNRDQSSDSRYWGFVPEQNIVGKAFLIWMNFGQLKRIGHGIH